MGSRDTDTPDESGVGESIISNESPCDSGGAGVNGHLTDVSLVTTPTTPNAAATVLQCSTTVDNQSRSIAALASSYATTTTPTAAAAACEADKTVSWLVGWLIVLAVCLLLSCTLLCLVHPFPPFGLR